MKFYIKILILLFSPFFTFGQNSKFWEEKANKLLEDSKIDSAVFCFNKAADVAASQNNALEYCKYKGKEGEIYYNEIEIEKSILLHQSLFDNHFDLLNENNPKLLYLICNRLGADYNYTNRQVLAQIYLEKAKEINERKDLKESGIYLNLYQYYKDQDNLIQAFSTLSKYQSSCLEAKDSLGLANTYFCYGQLHFKLSDFKKSLLNYEKAYEIYSKINKTNELNKPLVGMGNCYYALKKYKESIFQYKKSYPYCKTLESKGVCIVNIINTYVDMNVLDSAKIYITQYEKIRSNLTNFEVDHGYQNALSGYEEGRGNWKKAIAILEKNMPFYQNSKSKTTLLDMNERLAKAYLNIGNSQKAYEILSKAGELKDHISKEKLQVIDSLTVQFLEGQNKVVQQEQSNKILEQQNLIQKRNNLLLWVVIALFAIIFISTFLNDRLKSKKDKAELLAKEKTEDFNTYRYSVSHDLKNPLLHAQQHLSEINFFLSKENKNGIAETVLKAQNSIKNVNDFLSRLKDFSASENQETYEIEFEAKPVIEQIFEEYSREIKSKNITVNIAQLPTIFTDKILFINILSNLISNAIKFYDGEKNSKIEVFFVEKTLVIKDNGVGISPDILTKSFEPFVREFSEIEGAGLGLAIVKRLSNLLRLEINLENNLEGGVCAKINGLKTV
jgi:signal transduction histidine kinase